MRIQFSLRSIVLAILFFAALLGINFYPQWANTPLEDEVIIGGIVEYDLGHWQYGWPFVYLQTVNDQARPTGATKIYYSPAVWRYGALSLNLLIAAAYSALPIVVDIIVQTLGDKSRVSSKTH